MSEESSDEPERTVIVRRLKPDRVDDYIEAHEDVPNSVVSAMEKAGVEEYDLYVHDDIVVSIIEAPDLERLQEINTHNPEVQAWEDRVGQYKRSNGEQDGTGTPVMERIWTLSEERE